LELNRGETGERGEMGTCTVMAVVGLMRSI